MGPKTSRILVVDDDPQVLSLFGRILEKGGYSVRLVSSGNRFLEALGEEPFDLVVMDLSMPQPDGFELLKRLKTEMPGLKVLAVSGYLPGSLLRAAGLLGAAFTLAKADAPKKLLESVQRLLAADPGATTAGTL